MLTCIENNMARLMERPTYIASNTPDPTYPPVVEKVMAIIDRFVEKYGSVQLETFRLPTSSASELQRYLNSLTITLRRQGIIVAYAWQYHPSAGAYYLYLFHVDPTHGSISGVVHRLWHGSSPITQLDNIPVSSYNLPSVKDRLLRLILSLGSTVLASPSPFYRHTYGTSFSV